MINYKKKYEFAEVLIYLILAIIVIYFIPSPLNKYLSLLILPVVWLSKRDYFWLAFYIILLDSPGGFFSGGSADDPYRLPFYNFGPGISFTITEFFFLLILLKSLMYRQTGRKRVHVFFNKELIALGVYFVFLVVMSFLYGISYGPVVAVFKTTIKLTIIFSIFYMLSNKNELVSFFKIIFPFVFIAVALQAYSLIFKNQLSNLFDPGYTSRLLNLGDIDNVTSRPTEMVVTVFLSFTGSLYLLGIHDRTFKERYLVLISILSYFSIFMTATRSWTFAFTGAFLLLLLLSRRRLPANLTRIAVGFLAVLVILNFIPVLSHQVDSAWMRLSTIKGLSQGDLTLGGTAARYDEYAPELWKGFKQSSIIFGAAFSDLYFEYRNAHIGYHMLILNVGIIGMLLILILLFKIIKVAFTPIRGARENLTKYATIPFFILIIINTGVAVIGYDIVHNLYYIMEGYALVLLSISYNSSIPLLRPRHVIKERAPNEQVISQN